MKTKLIPERYFNELKNSGHTVPRNESNGEIITSFKVGDEYNIGFEKNGETVKARCTQSHPHHLKLIGS